MFLMAVVGLVLLTVVRHKLLSSEDIEINLSTEKPPALRGPIVATQDHLPTHVKEEYSIHKAIPVSNGHNSWSKDSLSQKLDSPVLKESLGAGSEELSDPIDFKEAHETEINRDSRNIILPSSPVIPEDKSESTLKDAPLKEDADAIEPSPQTDPPIRTPQTIPDLSAEVKITQQVEQRSGNRSQAMEHSPQIETPANTSHAIPLLPRNELAQPVEPLPETLIDTQHIVPSPPEVTHIKQHSVDPQSENTSPLHPLNGEHSQSLHQLTETPLNTSHSISLNSLKTEDIKSIESLSQHTEALVKPSQLADESTLVRTPVVTSLEKKESHEGIEQKISSHDPQTKTLISGYSTGES